MITAIANRMEVVQVAHGDAAAAAEWDAFAASAPGGTFCHAWHWRTVLRSVMGHDSVYLTARGESGEVRGVLPLVRVRSRLFGDHLVSMPFLNYGGALGDAEAVRALHDAALTEARALGVDLLELRSTVEAAPIDASADVAMPDAGSAESAHAASALRSTARKVTVVLPLPEDPQELWEKGFRSKLRSQIRRPMKEGMDIRFGPEQVDPFYDVFARNMRDLGTPVLPRSFFHAIAASFEGCVVFGVVYHGDTPAAAGCGFTWGDEFEITWASSVRDLNRLSPNMLLYWGLMEHVIGRGMRRFNFGRCTPGGSTHQFKLQWGGADVPLPWLTWSPSGQVATPSPDSAKFRLAISVWSRLPLALTNRVGPALARSIP